VLLLHGWPLSGVTYRNLVEALKPHYRCIVPDLPGAGDTPWSPNIHDTMTDFASLMREFVDHLKLDRFALIGHDSGGGVARLLAAEVGPRVRCLILQNTELPNHAPWFVRALKVSAESKLAAAGLGRLLRSRRFRQSPLGFGECFGDTTLIEGEFLETAVKPLIRDLSGANAMLAHLDLAWTKRIPEVHARIQAPIHLFWGEADKFFPIERARAMQPQFPRGGQFEVIPNGKLFVHEEASEALARFSLANLQNAFADSQASAQPPLPA